MDGVHLIVSTYYEDAGVGSLARFATLRTLSLRQANYKSMFQADPSLPSGLRCAGHAKCPAG